MPTILYKGDIKSFSVTGGCLAVMGRNLSAMENIKYQMDSRSMSTVKTVKFRDILQLERTKLNSKYLDVFTAYMNMFPFMRCVKTSYEKILTSTDCTFDAENYTQNEVMHAMFHIRQLAYARHTGFDGNKYLIQIIHKLVGEGVPFWKAFTLSMIPFHINPNYTLKPFNRVLEADANTFMLKTVTVDNFKDLISGRKPEPEYEGGTISENAKREKPYVQNMSNYLSEPIVGSKKVMSDFLTQVISVAQRTKSGGGVVVAFGHPLGANNARYDLSTSDLLNALNKVLHKHGITGKGKVKC